VKYYDYLSVSTVDMLFPKVARALRETVSAEIGFDLGVVSGSVGSEAARFDDAVTRLLAVERHLATQALGTIEQPRDWFAGEMMAQTSGLWTGGGAVFFLGLAAGTLVALGGSTHNLLGGESSRGEGPPVSNLAPMMKALETLVASETVTTQPVLLLAESELRVAHSEETLHWPHLVQLIAHFSRSPRQSVHFVARLLASETSEGQRVILGTPLYVAGGAARAA
jgi:hypothetical protein